MNASPSAVHSYRGSRIWFIITFVLLAAAWVAFFLVRDYGLRLAERYGRAPDVVDALNRDAYVCSRTVPYYLIMLLLDALALGSLAAPSGPGWFRAPKILL